jgi:hypothetical protein
MARRENMAQNTLHLPALFNSSAVHTDAPPITPRDPEFIQITQEMELYRERFETTMEQIHKLKEQMAAHSAEFTLRAWRTAPHRRLSFEILANIFVFLASDPKGPLFAS